MWAHFPRSSWPGGLYGLSPCLHNRSQTIILPSKGLFFIFISMSDYPMYLHWYKRFLVAFTYVPGFQGHICTIHHFCGNEESAPPPDLCRWRAFSPEDTAWVRAPGVEADAGSFAPLHLHLLGRCILGGQKGHLPSSSTEGWHMHYPSPGDLFLHGHPGSQVICSPTPIPQSPLLFLLIGLFYFTLRIREPNPQQLPDFISFCDTHPPVICYNEL